jgi:hypothetical protein
MKRVWMEDRSQKVGCGKVIAKVKGKNGVQGGDCHDESDDRISWK